VNLRNETCDNRETASPAPAGPGVVLEPSAHSENAGQSESQPANPPGVVAPQDRPGTPSPPRRVMQGQDQMNNHYQLPTYRADRTPSEWEAAFMAEQARVMGGSDSDQESSTESFQAERTPSEWERAFFAEKTSAMNACDSDDSQAGATPEAPSRADSFGNLSAEELERRFMAEMAEAMGSSRAVPRFSSAGSCGSNRDKGVSPRSDIGVSRFSSTGSASSKVILFLVHDEKCTV
jgi:hypothetical protein